MEKLMIKYEDGHYVPVKLCTVDRTGEPDDIIGCPNYDTLCEGEDCDNCPTQEAFNRLAEYEANELTPEEIRNLNESYREKLRELEKLKQDAVSVIVKGLQWQLDDINQRIMDSGQDSSDYLNQIRTKKIDKIMDAIRLIESWRVDWADTSGAQCVVFPCQIGDRLFELEGEEIITNKVIGYRIGQIGEDEDYEEYTAVNEWHIEIESHGGAIRTSVPLSEFGKSVFSTRKDAEDKLRSDKS